MTSLAQVGARLRATITTIRAGAALAVKASTQLSEATDRLRDHLRGADVPSATGLISSLLRAVDRARNAAAAARRSAAAVEAYMVTIGISVSDGDPPMNPAASPEPVPHLAAVAGSLRAMLPRGAKTVGMLVSPDGRTRSKPIWSGEDGPGQGAPGLRRDSPLRWHQMASATQHVEGHAAAVLRRPDAPKQAVLVVSAPPCGGPKGCHRRLAEMLSEGTTLRVYVAGDNGTTTWWADYHGNGRGVA
ncbi:DddA-like double-stranded DNA deaminase toxin [Plantactinospora sp. CA-290183]|uniref:DddA-like double-stranded DNA deaminase toxin n=1 Tax=Plantactinospora sp. CA-290183 TaxID=3240006 RepID=UPI003D8C81C3